jgi:hypothetical protein
MRRFKDDNSTKIVTAADFRAFVTGVGKAISNFTQWPARTFNTGRGSFLQNKPLGETPLKSDPSTLVPVVPSDITKYWQLIDEALKGAKQADDILAGANQLKAAGGGVALGLMNAVVKMPFLNKDSVFILAGFLSGGQILSAILQVAKRNRRAKFYAAGGGKIYDMIKNIYEQKYTVVSYDRIPAARDHYDKTKIHPAEWLKAGEEEFSLKEIYDIMAQNPVGPNEGKGAFGSQSKMYTFKDQQDVENINEMLYRFGKDEDIDTFISKMSPYLGPVALYYVWSSNRVGGDWRQQQQADAKNSGTSKSSGTSNSSVVSPTEQERINAIERMKSGTGKNN